MKKRIVSIILILCMLTTVVNVQQNKLYASEGEIGRIINVVYDDSGSMVKDNGEYILRWSQAKYAVEVFAAMMGSSDIMNVFPMSLEGGLGLMLKGTDADRVSMIHNMNARYSDTPFTTVNAAAQNLMDTSTNKEKWLVIITDGAFDDGATSVDTVYNKIDECNEKGIKVIYLAIGEGAANLNGNNKGFYADKAEDGHDVLDKVMKMANQIFTHMVVPEKRISISGNVSTLDIDIPIEKIMVFAQGDNVSINGLKHNGKEIKPSEVKNVKYSDVKPENYPDAIIDTSLKGVVATYEAESSPFESGKFVVDISGAQNVQYYYSPGVKVNCDLLLNGSPVTQEEELYAGDYEIEMNFIDPMNGKIVTSDLLAGAMFSLGVENNGSNQLVDGTKGKVSLVEGEVILNAEAYLPDEITLTSEKKYNVLPKPKNLLLDVSKEKGAFNADEIADEKISFILKVSDESTGKPLSDSEWNQTKIIIDDKSGLCWDINKGSEVSTWTLIPRSQDGTITKVPIGNLTIIISADYQIDNQYAFGATRMELLILEYQGDDLLLEAKNQPIRYTLDDLEKEDSIVVFAYIKNKESGEKAIISETLWNSLSIDVSTKSKIELDCKRGEELGSFIIQPKYYKDNPLKTSHGKVDIEASAVGQEGEREYSGKTIIPITIEKLSRHKWLILMAPKLIALTILLFVLFGYIKKKRVKTKGLNPHNMYKTKVSGKRKIKKKLLTVLLPYVDEVAIVQCRNPGYECYFPNLTIRATSKNTFRIKNGNIDVKSILINGAKISDLKDIKKQNFNYSGFQITSIDTKNNNKKLGSFVFR